MPGLIRKRVPIRWKDGRRTTAIRLVRNGPVVASPPKLSRAVERSRRLIAEQHTWYAANGFDERGYDSNGFDAWGIHRDTKTYADDGFTPIFGRHPLSAQTGKPWDGRDFLQSGMHRKTGTYYDAGGYDRLGFGQPPQRLHALTGTPFAPGNPPHDFDGLTREEHWQRHHSWR